MVHTAFARPGTIEVQVFARTDGAAFLCFARSIDCPASRLGEPRPTRVIAMGCDFAHASEVVCADGIDLQAARVGIGLSCRLCECPDWRSRAFRPIEHRLALDPLTRSASPYRFEAKSA
ncbi:MAG: short-chain fatty acyl-CoA regulator family protein [Acetobacteraceae bacterium]